MTSSECITCLVDRDIYSVISQYSAPMLQVNKWI